jgi:hypothetical protein
MVLSKRYGISLKTVARGKRRSAAVLTPMPRTPEKENPLSR